MAGNGGSSRLPERIGPYEILDELGRGGMGIVYTARDARLERRVAVKVLSQELSRDREWNARFTREARLLASLNHPNIATIYSLERDGDRDYLTMELITGRSLDVVIQTGGLALPEALSIGRQIARALEAAHGAGVIHRDLKPLNIMITSEANAKVLDFGLATRAASEALSSAPEGFSSAADGFRSAGPLFSDGGDDLRSGTDTSVATAVSPLPIGADDVTAVSGVRGLSEGGLDGGTPRSSSSARRRASSTTGVGTPGYMSPEQIRGEILDARSDMWAFGCVLYECLSGMRAFRGATPIERMQATIGGEVDLTILPPQTPAPVRDLIRRCLEPDRNARLDSATQARQLLESVLRARSWEPAAPDPGDANDGARARAEIPHSLPSEVTPLIGRSREIAQVRELLQRGRLVTLTGVGGAGKTRLAIRAGSQLLEEFADGVWMVELAPAGAGPDVSRAVARTLGVVESAGVPLPEALATHLSRRSLLLILDNCEHVVEASADLAGKLLVAAPGLKILATSRESLGLPGESVFQVPPLEVGTSASLPFEVLAATESIQLFAQRAAQVRADFRVEPENIGEIAEICRRLDGIPLAIELAAARLRALSLAEIARRLDDRFRLLKGTSRSALPHHQTLEALIEWSHAGLTESEKRLFRRLSLFRGGWTLEAAETVCADSELQDWEVLDVLSRLIDKSLVAFTPAGGPEDGGLSEAARAAGPRYRMLETIREYAQARLRDSDDIGAVEGRFQGHFIALAETAAQHLTGPSQSEWLARLDAEIDNVRAAIDRSLEGEDALPALRITGPMLRYWMIRAQWREGRAAYERAIAMPGAEAHLAPFGNALNGLGSCCFQLNDLEAAAKHYHRAVDGFVGTAEQKRAGAPLVNLGNVHRVRGELDEATASLIESLRYFDESDQWMIAAVQMNLGSIALTREEYEEARTRYESAIAGLRKLGDRVHTAMSVMNLGLVAYRQQRYAEALSLLEESDAIFRELGDRNMGAAVQANLGIVHLQMGAYAESLQAFTKALLIVRETGNIELIASCLEGFSQAARLKGDVRRAARFGGAAESVRTKFSLARHPVDQREWETENRTFALQVGEDVFARHWAEGQALEQDETVGLALAMAAEAESA
jgi:predicted ATPase/serine/threonine protein kinase